MWFYLVDANGLKFGIGEGIKAGNDHIVIVKSFKKLDYVFVW